MRDRVSICLGINLKQLLIFSLLNKRSPRHGAVGESVLARQSVKMVDISVIHISEVHKNDVISY